MNKSKRPKRYADITLSILGEIARIMEISVEGFLDPYKLRDQMKYDASESSKFFNRLHSMNRRGYVEMVKDRSSQLSVKLTNKGRIRLLEDSDDNESDGKWRIISFDIPEKLSQKRNSFRRIIKRIGFKQIQKSLWICPYNKADQIELVINELKINQYVAYFIVEKTDINDYLIRKFKK